MLKTSELTGAQLDYYVARAEGVPAEDLFFHRAPYTGEVVCASRHVRAGVFVQPREHVLRYSTDWAQGGLLIEKHGMTVRPPETFVPWEAHVWRDSYWYAGAGATPLQAICRTVVRAAFGDEVEEVPVCE